MPIQTTSKIWHNGNLIPWEDATLHVMSHVIHYGSSVFEGIRCYGQPHGSAVFRLPEHMQRLIDSAKIYRMELPYSLDELCAAVVDVIEANGVAPCYIRPIALRGYGEIGVSPKGSPIEVYIANFPWGKYIAGHGGADVCVSSWNRLAPNTMPALAKAGANYMNSQLIRMEAEINGYQEGIALDVNGLVSEGSGENIFVVRNGVIYTPPLGNSALSGITRDSVLTIARHLGLHADELRVHVVGAGLGQRGHGVGRQAVPAGDADVRAARARHVFAPGEVGDVDLHGAALGIDADFAVAAQRDGPDVARRHAVGLDHVDHAGAQLVEREGQRHAVNLGRVEQALHVLGQAKHRRPVRLPVAANALKHAGAIVDHVAHHVNVGLLPGNQVAVVPDLRGGLDGHESLWRSLRSR